jgi:hypothetical protein
MAGFFFNSLLVSFSLFFSSSQLESLAVSFSLEMDSVTSDQLPTLKQPLAFEVLPSTILTLARCLTCMVPPLLIRLGSGALSIPPDGDARAQAGTSLKRLGCIEDGYLAGDPRSTCWL